MRRYSFQRPWGFREIQEPRRKCARIANERLRELTAFDTYDELRVTHKAWGEASLADGGSVLESKWTRSIALGCEAFVEGTKEKLGVRAKGRKIMDGGSASQLREPEVSYWANFHQPKSEFYLEKVLERILLL